MKIEFYKNECWVYIIPVFILSNNWLIIGVLWWSIELNWKRK